ncbi:hypothetical protein Misp02_34560 [Microtetraspora sp. NBRC 16547]|nr:hypothetical protein Misp02_34560 [Microtetraspora sp. NBRC 16547]
MQSLPAVLADELGIFAKHGLEVTLLNVQGGPAGTSAVLSGSADVMLNGTDNVTLARAAKGGPDLVVVSGNTSKQINSLIVRSDLPTPNLDSGYPEAMRDLAGKKIGVPARGSSLENITRIMLKAADMDPDKDVIWLALGTAQAMATAIQTGQVDALLAPEPLLTQTVLKGDAKFLVDMRTGKPEELQWPFNMWWALRGTIQKKHDSIGAFQEAMKETFAYLQDDANLDEILPHVQKFMGVDEATARKLMSPLNISTFGYRVSESGMLRLWEHMKDLNLIDTVPDYKTVVDAGAR